LECVVGPVILGGQIPDFYTLLPEDEDSIGCVGHARPRHLDKTTHEVVINGPGGCDNPDGTDTLPVTQFISCYLIHAGEPAPTLFVLLPGLANGCVTGDERKNEPFKAWLANPDSPDAYTLERRLAHARRFILVVQSEQPPWIAMPGEPIFASYCGNGLYYYISARDNVSKKELCARSRTAVNHGIIVTNTATDTHD
jgi:hypothetical protein